MFVQKRGHDDLDELRNQVSMPKNVQRTQAQVIKANRQAWEAEREAFLAEKQTLKDEKKKLEYAIYDLLKQREVDTTT